MNLRFRLGVALLFVFLSTFALNTFAQTLLVSGSSYSGTLAAGATKKYRFNGVAGASVYFRMAETVSGSGQVLLYRPDGSYWTFGNNEAGGTLSETGTYTVEVRFSSSTNSGRYTLHYVMAGSSVENGVLASGRTVSDNLSSYDFDSFTFDGVTGADVLLRMNESASSSGQILLYRPDGSYWTFGNNEVSGKLPSTGSYTVVVRLSTASQTGNYSLHYVQGGKDVEKGEIFSGTTVSNALGTYDFDSYSFEGNSGESVLFRMQESASSSGQILLYRPDGSYWTFGNNEVSGNLTQTGIYTVVVKLSTSSQAGSYALHYVRGSDSVENGALISGATVSDSLASYDFDSFNFAGNAGEYVLFRMAESASSSGQILLYKPDGSYWTFGNNEVGATLPEDGVYMAVVKLSTSSHSGDYQLHYVHPTEEVENGQLVSGTATSNSMDSYDFDSYVFNGVAGQYVYFSMQESTSSAGQILLFRPDGSYWTFGNNSVGGTLAATGTYTLVVKYSTSSHFGDYTLHTLLAGTTVENGSIASGASVHDFLDSYDIDSFTFTGSINDVVNFSMLENVSGSGQILLFRPDGSYWTFGNNNFTGTLPATGVYTVMVRFSTGSNYGDYTLNFGLTQNLAKDGFLPSDPE